MVAKCVKISIRYTHVPICCYQLYSITEIVIRTKETGVDDAILHAAKNRIKNY